MTISADDITHQIAIERVILSKLKTAYAHRWKSYQRDGFTDHLRRQITVQGMRIAALKRAKKEIQK